MSWRRNQSSNEDEAFDHVERKQKKKRSGKSDLPSRKRTKRFALVIEVVIMTKMLDVCVTEISFKSVYANHRSACA